MVAVEDCPPAVLLVVLDCQQGLLLSDTEFAQQACTSTELTAFGISIVSIVSVKESETKVSGF
jgi:hypothetical protein